MKYGNPSAGHLSRSMISSKRCSPFTPSRPLRFSHTQQAWFADNVRLLELIGETLTTLVVERPALNQQVSMQSPTSISSA